MAGQTSPPWPPCLFWKRSSPQAHEAAVTAGNAQAERSPPAAEPHPAALGSPATAHGCRHLELLPAARCRAGPRAGEQLERRTCGELLHLRLHRTSYNDGWGEVDRQGWLQTGHEGVRGTCWYPNSFSQEMNHGESPANTLLPRTALPSGSRDGSCLTVSHTRPCGQAGPWYREPAPAPAALPSAMRDGESGTAQPAGQGHPLSAGARCHALCDPNTAHAVPPGLCSAASPGMSLAAQQRWRVLGKKNSQGGAEGPCCPDLLRRQKYLSVVKGPSQPSALHTSQ